MVFAQFNVGQKIFILKYSRDAHFILHTKTIYRHGLTAMAPMTMFIALHYCYDHLYINFLNVAVGKKINWEMCPMFHLQLVETRKERWSPWQWPLPWSGDWKSQSYHIFFLSNLIISLESSKLLLLWLCTVIQRKVLNRVLRL